MERLIAVLISAMLAGIPAWIVYNILMPTTFIEKAITICISIAVFLLTYLFTSGLLIFALEGE